MQSPALVRLEHGTEASAVDLVALGLPDPGALERCTNVFPFRGPAEALGWLYVIERDAMLHGILLRHLEQRLGDPFATRPCLPGR